MGFGSHSANYRAGVAWRLRQHRPQLRPASARSAGSPIDGDADGGYKLGHRRGPVTAQPTTNKTTGLPVAKPNYQFEKRQKELAKKKKKEEKLARKQAGTPEPADEAGTPEEKPAE
jgi:hypothetical protein